MFTKAPGIIEKINHLKRNTTISTEEFKEIERYLLKEMPEGELQLFTNKLDSDQELRDRVHTVRLIIVGIQEDKLAQELQRYHSVMKVSEETPQKKPVINLKFFLVAASILIMAAISIFLFLNNPDKGERLFTEYYKPDSGLISSMSSSDDYIFDRAMIDYKTGDYKAAIKSWDSLLTQKPGNDTLQFFLASAYLAMDKYEESITHFKEVTTRENSNFLEDANWYLDLVYLKTNQKDKAIPYIQKSAHPQKDELLEKLLE